MSRLDLVRFISINTLSRIVWAVRDLANSSSPYSLEELPQVIRDNADRRFKEQIERGSLFVLTTKDLSGITKIGNMAFEGWRCLYQVDIPDGVTSIEFFAFKDCDNLDYVRIPKSVTYIGYESFQGCSHLKCIIYSGTEEEWKQIEFGLHNEKILTGVKIFYNQDMYRGTLLNGVSYAIGEKDVALESCNVGSEENIVWEVDGKPVTAICQHALQHNKEMTEFRIPESVKQICDDALVYGKSLSVIYLDCSSVPVVGENSFPSQATIYVNEDIYDAIITDEKWAPYVNQIQIKPKEEV